MTDEEFYGAAFPVLKEAERILLEMAERYMEEAGNQEGITKKESKL